MSTNTHCYVCDGINDEIRESLCFKLCKPCYDTVLISTEDMLQTYGITDSQLFCDKEWRHIPSIPSSYGERLYVHDDVKKIVLAKRGSLDWYMKRKSKQIVLQKKRHDAIQKSIKKEGLYFSPGHHLIAKYIISGKPSIKSIIHEMLDEKCKSDKVKERYDILHKRLQKEGLPTNHMTNKTEIFVENADNVVDTELETRLEEAVKDVYEESEMTKSQLKEKYSDKVLDKYYDECCPQNEDYDYGSDTYVTETVNESDYYFEKEKSYIKE